MCKVGIAGEGGGRGREVGGALLLDEDGGAAPRGAARRRSRKSDPFFVQPEARTPEQHVHPHTHARTHTNTGVQTHSEAAGGAGRECCSDARCARAECHRMRRRGGGSAALGGWRALGLACRRAMTLCGHALSRAWRRPGELPRSGYRGSKQPMGPPTSARRCATQARGAVRASPAAGTPRRRTRLMRAGSQRRDSDPAQWATPARTAT